MRLDKYIKITRLIKRRGVAKVLIDEGSITVNEKIVKPSYEVKLGDIVLLKLGKRLIKIEVLSLKDNASKNEALKLYKLLEEKLTTN